VHLWIVSRHSITSALPFFNRLEIYPIGLWKIVVCRTITPVVNAFFFPESDSLSLYEALSRAGYYS
jgi:hypothetical protein